MPRTPVTRPDVLELHAVRALAVAMKKQKISGRSAAPKVGVSHSQLGRILAGEKPITLTQFDRLCVLLGLAPYDVLREAQAKVTGRPVATVPAYTIQRVERNGDGQGPVKVSPEPGKRRTRRLASSPTPPDRVEED